MKTLSVFYLSSKHLLRLYISNSTLRYTFIFIVLVFMLLGLTLGIAFGLNPPPQWKDGFRSPEFVTNLSGLFFILNNSILMIPTFLTIRGSLKLMQNPESLTLLMISPVSSVTKFWSSIGPLIFFSSIPYLLTILPFVVMFLFLDPLISFSTLLYFVIISGWSVVLCFTSLVGLVKYAGREKAMRLSYAIPFILLLAPALFTLRAEDFRSVAPIVGYWQLVFFSVSILFLPPLFKGAASYFYTLITTKAEAAKEFSEPDWGRYNPWLYLQRQSASLGLIPLGIFVILMLGEVFYFEGINQAVFSILVFVFVTAPINIVMQEERSVPYRWLLAPFSAKIRKTILLKMSLPLLVGATIAVIIMGFSHHLWITIILFNLLLAVLVSSSHKLHSNPALQTTLYFLTLAGCFIAQLAW